jgi:ElaA protein
MGQGIGTASPMVTTTHWVIQHLADMPAATVYAMARLRSEIFVVEQQCVFLDLDGSDDLALHVLGYQGSRLVAYARCFGPGVKFAEASIGRIAISMSARGTGLGHLLVQQAKDAVNGQWGVQAVRIGAQARLKPFYERHGFVDTQHPYVEDGIAHLEMLWDPMNDKTTGIEHGK